MEVIVIILAIIFSAFFSGIEIAYVTANRLKMEIASKDQGLQGRIIEAIINNPAKFIATMLVGNNIALVIYGIYFSALLEPIILSRINNHFYVFLIQTIISTILILVVAEFLPKTIFRIIGDNAIKIMTIPIGFFYYLFTPLVRFIVLLSSVIAKLFFKIKIDDNFQNKVFTKHDIEAIIDDSNVEDLDDESNINELRIFQNALDFSKIKLRECIIPRNKIVAVPKSASIQSVRDKFIETGHSNILVYNESVDEITGYVNVKDIFKNPSSIDEILRQVFIVPETMSARKLFEKLLKSKKSIAVVVDEFGATSGLVTVEDIIEEIFGEFEDEHDNPDAKVIITKEGNYIISGSQEVDLLNLEFDLNLSESDEYETIAGYILHHTGSFPKENALINITDNNRNIRFKILRISGTKIEKVLLYKD
ncbi:MAG: hemolysin family protein [Bacteroidales bacterium]|jgi:CBS domain containing-hemolysin-like protein|nr:hemolysin family protein [Bacteroidales bacterium]HOL97594.1 hemolysin family protein [Bacteroidales bacterium]HUM32695.1 hemolysin family protein [Bacteroidales bacterium]